MRRVNILAAVTALIASLAVVDVIAAPPAAAAAFNVGSPSDLPDFNPGNGVCATIGGTCTVRAAIEESNALPGTDTITIPAGTYALDSQLFIEDNVFITGAGKGVTILDGQDVTDVLRIRTTEALVCDSTNDSVRSFDRHGQLNGSFLPGGTNGLDGPVDVTVREPDFDVFVTGSLSGVHRFPLDGPPGELFTSDPVFPTSTEFGPEPDFDLFATEFQIGGGIERYDRTTGASLGTFVAAGSGGLSFPNSMKFEGDYLYVASAGTDEILRYNATTGAFVDDFVSANLGGLDEPRNLAFHDGSLFVSSDASSRVLRYSATTGAWQDTFVEPGDGGLDSPTDISFGPDGHFYVVSAGTDQVLRYDGETGEFIDVFVQGGNFNIDSPSCIEWRDGMGNGPIASITGLDIANGLASLGSTAGLIVDIGATLTATEVTVRDNRSSSFGGGIQNWGSLTLRRSEVARNELPEGGGGQTSQGGGIFNSGNLDIEESLIADNYATRGGGISNTNEGQVDVLNSTISGNRANGAGGGIRNVANGRFDISFATITNNRANEPGGDDEIDRLGGGIFNSSTAHISMANSILAENVDNRSDFDDDFAPDCYSPGTHDFISERDNIIGILNENCDFTDVSTGDHAFIAFGTEDDPLDPLLNTLGFNTGPTRTHALLANSPAIDGDVAGTSATFFDCGDEDQRTQPRPIDGDSDGSADCDLGAFEYQPPSDSDDDGLPDAIDPSEVADAVKDLPNEAFKAKGHRNALLAQLESAEMHAHAGRFDRVAEKLEHLLERVDGCETTACHAQSMDHDDWVVDCAAQLPLRELIQAQLNALDT